ncbi:MAG: hypothetical protein NPIRA02_21880 [Nitrospirales bacterium]|nr:MAG: hypothetical protein NPIRA02_21880 [Nitrospirales bacterium]
MMNFMQTPEEWNGVKEYVLSIYDEIEKNEGHETFDPGWPHDEVKESPPSCFSEDRRPNSPRQKEHAQDQDIDAGYPQIDHPTC